MPRMSTQDSSAVRRVIRRHRRHGVNDGRARRPSSNQKAAHHEQHQHYRLAGMAVAP